MIRDVIEHVWNGAPPKNPRVATEVKMEHFGNVDFVIADVDPQGNITEFISVELQAVDCTGSVEPAYTALMSNQMLRTKSTYGINWANVRKRYVSQLITKGFYHHHWRTRMVSIIQEELYESFRASINFDELPVKDNPSANIVFMVYGFEPNPESDLPGAQRLALKRVTGTSHNSLMMSALYHTPPDKQAFCAKIISRL